MVRQTVVDDQVGNCTQAVVASYLNLPLWYVPNFVLYDNFRKRLQEFFLKEGYVYHGAIHPHVIRDHWPANVYIASGPSMTFPSEYHVILVDYWFQKIWDPNPGDKGILDIHYVWGIERLGDTPPYLIELEDSCDSL